MTSPNKWLSKTSNKKIKWLKPILRIWTYFRKPKRIWANAPSKYVFYDHAKFASSALNPLSRLFDAGIREYMRCTPLSSSSLVKSLSSNIQRDGIVVFSMTDLEGGTTLFDQLSCEMLDEIAKVKREIDEWLVGLNNQAGTEAHKEYVFRLPTPASLSNPCWRLAIHPQILAVVNEYIHAHAKIQSMQYLINARLTEQRPKNSQLWHRDGDGTCIKLFVYLSDVGRESGPFFYACGSHQGKKRSIHGADKKMDDVQLNKLFGGNISIKEVTGRAGTVILANTCGYHKGGFVQVGSRHILHVSYFCPWIDRSDYSLALPADVPNTLHPAQIAAIQ